jgi:hypothetical protein
MSNHGRYLAAVAPVLLALTGCGGGGSDAGGPGPGPANRPPSISGTPPSSVVVGDAYRFSPQASDADGDSLVFSVQNLPTWAGFSTTTGTISGTPGNGDVGAHSGIVVSVSDGQQSASIPSFGIDVTQVGIASTTLSWTAPTMNSDGTVLTDLAGYTIYYGTSSRNYTNEIRIDNPGMTMFVVDGLAPATYFFAAKAFNASGVESDFSAEASATLTGT